MFLRYEVAQDVDIEEIYTFCKDLIAEYETDPIDPDKVLPWCKRKITSCISEYRRILREDETAGYFHLSTLEDGSLELDDFYLYQSVRGQGIGSEVLRELCSHADEKQQKLLLYVFKKNEGAVRLYERYGFQIAEKAGNSRWIMTRTPK